MPARSSRSGAVPLLGVLGAALVVGALLGGAARGASAQGAKGTEPYVLDRAAEIIRLNADAIPNKYRARPSPTHAVRTTIDDGGRGSEKPLDFKACRLDVDILWRNDVGSGVLSAPLVADVQGVFENQVVVAAHRFYLELLDGHDGHPMPGWPYVAEREEFVAAPVLVDVNADGVEEVLAATKSGSLLLFSPGGERLLSQAFRLPKLPVHVDWADGIDSPNASATFSLFDHRIGETFGGGATRYGSYYEYFYDDPRQPEDIVREAQASKYVYVDPHILATPVLHDLNDDGVAELIVPVTYYFDSEEYRDPRKRDRLGADIDITKYVACSVLVIDLKDAAVINNYALDLTTARADWPAYLVSSPTVADGAPLPLFQLRALKHTRAMVVDGDGTLDIVVGTSVGFVYVLTQDGIVMPGFPITMDEVHTQVLVADLFNKRKMNLIVADRSGNIVAYDAQPLEVWETQLMGYPAEAMALGDVDVDGVLDLVVATSAGLLYLINAQTGSFLAHYPIRLSVQGIRAPPTLVALDAKDRSLTIVVPSTDGFLHIVNPSGCIDKIDLGTRVYSRVIAENVSNRGKMDLLLASADGEVICLSTEAPYHPLRATSPLASSPTPYRFGYTGVAVQDETRRLMHVTGRSFVLRFEILDQRPLVQTPNYMPVYHVKIYVAGSTLLFRSTYHAAGAYAEQITVPDIRFVGTVRVVMTNELHETYSDSFTLGFNVYFYRVLKWLVAAPLVALAVVLTFARQLDLPDLPVWRGGS